MEWSIELPEIHVSPDDVVPSVLDFESFRFKEGIIIIVLLFKLIYFF